MAEQFRSERGLPPNAKTPYDESPRAKSPLVKIELGVDESVQQSSFQNATLQGCDGFAFSIATQFEVPGFISSLGKTKVAEYIEGHLSKASSVVPGLSFHVQLGRDLDHENDQMYTVSNPTDQAPTRRKMSI